MGLFSKKPNTDKLLNEALSDYKSEEFGKCYQKVCEAAELGNPRAYFCKALLIYNDNVAPDSTPDFEVLEDLTRRAVEGGYAPAYGFYAFILSVADRTEELCEFLGKKNKIKDGVYLSYKASYLFGLYTDDEKADRATTISVMRESVEELADFNDKLASGKHPECE